MELVPTTIHSPGWAGRTAWGLVIPALAARPGFHPRSCCPLRSYEPGVLVVATADEISSRAHPKSLISSKSVIANGPRRARGDLVGVNRSSHCYNQIVIYCIDDRCGSWQAAAQTDMFGKVWNRPPSHIINEFLHCSLVMLLCCVGCLTINDVGGNLVLASVYVTWQRHNQCLQLARPAAVFVAFCR